MTDIWSPGGIGREMERVANSRQVGRGPETSMVKSKIDRELQGLLDGKEQSVEVPGTFMRRPKRRRGKKKASGDLGHQKRKRKRKGRVVPPRTKSGKFKKMKGKKK